MLCTVARIGYVSENFQGALGMRDFRRSWSGVRGLRLRARCLLSQSRRPSFVPAIPQKAECFRDGEFSHSRTRNREITKSRKCKIAMKLREETFYASEGAVIAMELFRARKREIVKSWNRNETTGREDPWMKTERRPHSRVANDAD